MNIIHFSALLALSVLPTSVAVAGGTTEQGFQQARAVYPIGSKTRTLTNGDILTYDGEFIKRFDATGALISDVASLPGSFFSGLFAVDPTESFAVVGESTNGDVFRVDLGDGTVTLLANLFFNFDADFGPDGMVYVSAATGGFGMGNDIVRLDPITGATTKLANVDGASGPLEFDQFGNLYYGTASSGWPTPPASSDVLLFLASDLATADCALPSMCLTESEAIPFSAGYDGASDMALDPQSGVLYMAENNFNTGASRIWRIQAGPPSVHGPMIDEANGNWTSSVEVLGGTSAKQLLAFQPSSDARMFYNSSGQRVMVTGKRPTLTISGPGMTGPGLVNLDVSEAAPGGGVLFAYGPTANLLAAETPFPLANFVPLFSDLDPATADVFGGVIPQGPGMTSAGLSFVNPGGLQGLLSIQALVIDTSFTQFLGTTNRVDF